MTDPKPQTRAELEDAYDKARRRFNIASLRPGNMPEFEEARKEYYDSFNALDAWGRAERRKRKGAGA